MLSPKHLLLASLAALSAVAAPVATDSNPNITTDLHTRGVNDVRYFTSRGGISYALKVVEQGATAALVGNDQVQAIWNNLYNDILNRFFSTDVLAFGMVNDVQGHPVTAEALVGSGPGTLSGISMGDWRDITMAAMEFWGTEEVPGDWQVDLFMNQGTTSIASLSIES
ncbi:hypothetical protein PRZ48_000007 [Zasmidium cellare]|uniref:Uncharacterized protein n=1 Tax=Zasmidium cellare TaxID=395010 RepID=A0ABR0EXD2_ZASCE|nr:hypothetical protein PRZ48_000007 [Zasmidium cellare]